MKKLSLFIIILIALTLFAAADYYLNNLDGQAVLDFKGQKVSDIVAAKEPVDFISSIFKLNEEIAGYKVASQVQTKQVFEKIDLSNINNIKIYKNRLEKDQTASLPTESDEEQDEAEDKILDEETDSKPIFLYEIHGPKDQGSLTYLNVKLQFISQINATTETINEDSSFGHNSFFFNDKNYENTAFILAQVGDSLFGFQYDRGNENTYNDIKEIIQKLMRENSI